jgi:hypothetical protein
MDLPMEPKIFGLLIAVLFFLISFLLNLLQRRYSKTRLDRMLMNEESVVNLLVAVNRYLGKLERNCVFELQGANSPQEVGKAIHVVRNKIESTIATIGEHLCSFRMCRRKRKVQGKNGRQTQKLHQRFSGRRNHGNI